MPGPPPTATSAGRRRPTVASPGSGRTWPTRFARRSRSRRGIRALAGRPMRLCFFGDSFVAGVGDPDHLGWPGRVCASVHARVGAVTHYNLGVRRDTSADVAVRWRLEAERRLPDGEDGRLVFSFGANDCALENGHARVALASSLAHLAAVLDSARRWRPTLMVGPPPVAEDNLRNSN